MPLIAIKLFEAKDKAALDADVAAYKGGAGSDLLDHQRGSDMHALFDGNSNDSHVALALAHGGLDIPAAAAKTADLQHVYVEDDKLVDAQAALDAALAQAVHATVTDAVTTTPGTVTSATGPFEAEDVGRIIQIAGVQKTITVHNSATSVDYDNADGDFASGTGLTLDLLGAEVLQAVHLNVFKEPDSDYRFCVMAAVEGELP
jgi:phenylpyruvate tautomerase PptA (4-oxalocrotonate tautomerase family)